MLSCLLRKREQDLERQRELIAHEIHDGACQYVAAAQAMFDAFRHAQSPTGSSDWSTFEMGMEFLSRVNDELRRLARGLCPIHLAAGGLQKAVECLLKEIREAGGPKVELCCDIEQGTIPEHLEIVVFRIVQESLANACRHSRSKRILVGLNQDEESLAIQVQDWGIGFDPDTIPQGHFGIEGIRQRVRLLHGDVTIHSNPGRGTLITVELPLRD
jgi:signal transduction histidine kinase